MWWEMGSCSAGIDHSLARAAGSTKLEGSRGADICAREHGAQAGTFVSEGKARILGEGKECLCFPCPFWQPDPVLTLPPPNPTRLHVAAMPYRAGAARRGTGMLVALTPLRPLLWGHEAMYELILTPESFVHAQNS